MIPRSDLPTSSPRLPKRVVTTADVVAFIEATTAMLGGSATCSSAPGELTFRLRGFSDWAAAAFESLLTEDTWVGVSLRIERDGGPYR